MKFGYARVSKNDQSLDVQVQKLKLAGCDEIFKEKISGAKDNRAQLQVLMIPIADNSVGLIVTSPPYVTSYEYADLHQLTALWLEYIKNLSDFRKRFIGTSQRNKKSLVLNSALAEKIRSELLIKDKKTAEEVATYFSEMNQVFIEIKRVLKSDGKACIVIGNTSLKGIEILSAEVFAEQLQNLGLKIIEIIKREIPSKNLPSIRDEKTGKFASVTDKNKVSAYPTEYILVMEKQARSVA